MPSACVILFDSQDLGVAFELFRNRFGRQSRHFDDLQVQFGNRCLGCAAMAAHNGLRLSQGHAFRHLDDQRDLIRLLQQRRREA